MIDSSEREIKQILQNCQKSKQNLPKISRVFRDYLETMEQLIKTHKRSSFLSGCCGRQQRIRYHAKPRFAQAFKALNYQEKVNLYKQTIQYALQRKNNISQQFTNKNEFKSEQQQKLILIVQSGFSQKQVDAKIIRFKFNVRSGPSFDLRHYLLRKSKKQNKRAYVLQCVLNIEPQIFRFWFKNQQDQKKYIKIFEDLVKQGYWESIKKMITINQLKQQKSDKPIFQKKTRTFLEHLQQNPKQDIDNLIIVSKQSIQSRGKDQKNKKNQQNLTNYIIEYTDEELLENNKYKNIIKSKSNNRLGAISSHKIKKKGYKNVYNQLFPTRSFWTISNLQFYKDSESLQYYNLKIFQPISMGPNPELFTMKLKMKLPSNPISIFYCLCSLDKYKYWHPCIKQGRIHMIIKQENCLIGSILYQTSLKLKVQTQYTIILHGFQSEDSYYIAQKSVQLNENIVPLETNSNGYIYYGLWKITPTHNGSQIMYQILMSHDSRHQKNLQKNHTKQYLLGFKQLYKYLSVTKNRQQLFPFLNPYWNIDKSNNNQQSNNQIQSKRLDTINTIQFGGYQIIQDNQFFSVDQNQNNSIESNNLLKQNKYRSSTRNSRKQQERQQFNNSQLAIQFSQDSPKKIKKKLNQFNDSASIKDIKNNKQQILIQVNSQGLIILPQQYIKHKYQLYPDHIKKQYPKFQSKYQNFVFQNDWILDADGDISFINKQKEAIMNGVVSHFLKKVANNIFSGKGILNVSLPVTIFGVDSNLQRLCKSWCLGPIFLERAAKTKILAERMKNTIAFSMGTLVFYFGIWKPFNPILGQTYQGWLSGCPIYAEQITHHPPITALYFIGRGYKVIAQLEAKVQIRMNSGSGNNDGLIKVLFDDQQTICFSNPKGQVSGLVIGKRKFQFANEVFYFDQQNRIFLELRYEEEKGFFSKKNWKVSCQISGDIVIVSQKFMKKFIDSGHKLKPKADDIEQKLHSVGGRWPYQLLIDNEVYYNIQQQMPDKLIEQLYPLNSHSNYREDLYYHKLQDLIRSQQQKERLQQFQRSDRKLRQVNLKSHKK